MSRHTALLGVLSVLLMQPAPARATACVEVPVLDDRCERWSASYDVPEVAGSDDRATSVVATPDGSRVLVVGASRGTGTGHDVAVLAFSAGGGERLWERRLGGPGTDLAYETAISGDGRTLYVVGSVQGSDGLAVEVAAIAVDSGALRWETRVDGASGSDDEGLVVDIAPDGSVVYVGGWGGTGFERDVVVLAVDSSSGELIWRAGYGGSGLDVPVGIHARAEDVTVIGWDSAGDAVAASWRLDEERRGVASWTRKIDLGGGEQLFDSDASPDGDTIYAVGSSVGPGGALLAPTDRFATLAIDAATGEERWRDLYRGEQAGFHAAISVAAGPGTVAVSGVSAGPTDDWDFATIAYEPLTGARRWVAPYAFPGSTHEVPQNIALAPDGSKVYVTGFSSNGSGSQIVTSAYAASDASPSWTARFNASPLGTDEAIPSAIAVTGSGVWVAGRSVIHLDEEDPVEASNATDYAIVAYDP